MTLVDGIHTNDVSALDRGLAYGDGLFETLAVVDGHILNWQSHADRLRRGCDALSIPQPDFTLLADEARAVASGTDRSVVKIIITRGSGGRGYTPAPDTVAVRIVTRHRWPDEYARREDSGINVCIAQHRISHNPHLAGVKHLNRLDQVLASIELAKRGVTEALMLDMNGFVIEATRCNIFAIHGDLMVTPCLNNCGVSGVMRSIILQLAPSVGLRSQETELTLHAVCSAGEVFLCNAIAGIWPVVSIDEPERAFTIGENTRLLQAALRAGNHH